MLVMCQEMSMEKDMINKKKMSIAHIVYLHFYNYFGLTTILIVSKFGNAILPFAILIATANFIDRVVVVQNHGALPAIHTAILLVALMIVQRLLICVVSLVSVELRSRMRPVIEYIMVDKVFHLPFAIVEDERTQEALARVMDDPGKILFDTFVDRIDIICFFITNASIIYLFAVQASWMVGLVLVILIVSSYNAVRNGKKQYKTNTEVSAKKRKAKYYEAILSDPLVANERFLFKFQKKINERYYHESQKARKRERKALFMWHVTSSINGYFAIGVSIVVIFSMLQSVISGGTSIGLYISLVSAFINMEQSITRDLAALVMSEASHISSLADFTYLFSIDCEGFENEQDSANSSIPFLSLEFRNVSFHYPGTEKKILDNVSFVLSKGRHYAFVGKNGSGKTTLIKLILRLYTPSSGIILLNGKSIDSYSKTQVWKMIGVVFQDFARYSVSVYDNIALGRSDDMKNDIDVERSVKRTKMMKIIEKLPQGIHTLLGKTTDPPIDLSGGEWQRVALARIDYSDAPLKILDEPTAALDAIQEQYIYRQFQQLYSDITTILITHRLGAIISSDCIFVLEDGRIVESGTHSFLMQQNGYYKTMYESQRSWYI